MLLTYNVIVIFLKSFLQLIGCLFYADIAGFSCSMAQLFGVACIEAYGMQFNFDVSIILQYTYYISQFMLNLNVK